MKKLSFLIIVLLLLGHPYSAFASKVCNNFFSSTLLILRNDYLPVFTSRVMRTKDAEDLHLLKES